MTFAQYVVDGEASFGDYNNDNYLDLIVAGAYSGTLYNTTSLYKNNGDNTFTEQITPIDKLISSSLAWGDYDNDGYLDLIIAGYLYFDTPPVTKLYHNDNGTGFTEHTGVSFSGAAYSSVVWGDYR